MTRYRTAQQEELSDVRGTLRTFRITLMKDVIAYTGVLRSQRERVRAKLADELATTRSELKRIERARRAHAVQYGLLRQAWLQRLRDDLRVRRELDRELRQDAASARAYAEGMPYGYEFAPLVPVPPVSVDFEIPRHPMTEIPETDAHKVDDSSNPTSENTLPQLLIDDTVHELTEDFPTAEMMNDEMMNNDEGVGTRRTSRKKSGSRSSDAG